MNRVLLLASMIGAMMACEEETPCDRYADYICECHADDPDYDCDQLRLLAEDPSEAVIDQCAIDLEDQEDADDEDGLTCAV